MCWPADCSVRPVSIAHPIQRKEIDGRAGRRQHGPVCAVGRCYNGPKIGNLHVTNGDKFSIRIRNASEQRCSSGITDSPVVQWISSQLLANDDATTPEKDLRQAAREKEWLHRERKPFAWNFTLHHGCVKEAFLGSWSNRFIVPGLSICLAYGLHRQAATLAKRLECVRLAIACLPLEAPGSVPGQHSRFVHRASRPCPFLEAGRNIEAEIFPCIFLPPSFCLPVHGTLVPGDPGLEDTIPLLGLKMRVRSGGLPALLVRSKSGSKLRALQTLRVIGYRELRSAR